MTRVIIIAIFATFITASSSYAMPETDNETISDNDIKMMDQLVADGYPVYDKNITICSGVTSPTLGEYIVLETSDDKDKVIAFYVALGGTPEDIGKTVVFRNWNMPIGVQSYAAGGGTAILYDVIGDVFVTDDEVEE